MVYPTVQKSRAAAATNPLTQGIPMDPNAPVVSVKSVGSAQSVENAFAARNPEVPAPALSAKTAMSAKNAETVSVSVVQRKGVTVRCAETAKNVQHAAIADVVRKTDVRVKFATRKAAASAMIKNAITEFVRAATNPDAAEKSVRTAVNATRVATTVANAMYQVAEAPDVEIAKNVLHAIVVIAVHLRTPVVTVQIPDVEVCTVTDAEIAVSAIKHALVPRVSAGVHVDRIATESVIALIRSAHAENVIVRVAACQITEVGPSGFHITETEVQVDL